MSAQIYAGFLTKESMGAATSEKRIAMRAAAAKLIELESENLRLRADSERLEWLLRNVSGTEFRKLGIFYRAGCERADVDRVMCEQEAEE